MKSHTVSSYILQNKKKDILRKREIVERIKNYKLSDNLPYLEFTTGKLQNGYLYYTPSFMVKDLSNNWDEEENELTILKVKALGDTRLDSHDHATQSQTIYVNAGRIVDLTTGLSFDKGQSFFNPKKKRHELQYLKGTVATIVFLPNLEIIN